VTSDKRYHLPSGLMGETLINERLELSGETPIVRMLPDVHVVKIGSSSLIEAGRNVLYPVTDALKGILENHRLILGVGGGGRSRHVFTIGMDLGLPTGVLAQLTMADSLGNAHILGALLAPQGVVAIPPEIFGHLLPLFIQSAPGVVFNGVPPYSLWEHPPAIGRIPPHRTDAGCFILGECFGCKSVTLVKDVDGVYDSDPMTNPSARLIPEISASELKKMRLPTLPFDEVLLDILPTTKLVRKFQVVNGLKPELIAAAINGEHVGTIIHA
jgi:molybdenum storage protein